MASIVPIGADGSRIPKGTKDRPVRYVARWRTPDGRSREKWFDRKRDAENHLAGVAVDAARGTYVDTSAGKTKFKVVAEQWATSQPHRASTAASVRTILDAHILPTFGERSISSITTSQVQAWVSGLELSPRTVVVVFGKLAAIFNAAVDDRLIASSPCKSASGRTKIRMPKPAGAQVTPMEPTDVSAMFEAAPERYRALLVLIAGTGLRPGEALGLTVDRIDFLRRTIRVDRQLVTMPNQEPQLGPVKTTSSVRTVPVPDDVLAALSEHLRVISPAEQPIAGLIFTDEKGDPIRRNALGHMWRRAAVKAKVADRTPHDLRHFAASVMIDRGLSVKAVQRQLGHASAKTTLDTYAHLWPDAEEATRAALSSGLSRVFDTDCGVGVGLGSER